jgi:hypothetical protein
MRLPTFIHFKDSQFPLNLRLLDSLINTGVPCQALPVPRRPKWLVGASVSWFFIQPSRPLSIHKRLLLQSIDFIWTPLNATSFYPQLLTPQKTHTHEHAFPPPYSKSYFHKQELDNFHNFKNFHFHLFPHCPLKYSSLQVYFIIHIIIRSTKHVFHVVKMLNLYCCSI